MRIILITVLICFASNVPADDAVRNTVALVVNAIEHNYEQIATAKMTITHEIVSPGGQIGRTTENLTLKGKDYFCEIFDPEGKLACTHVLHGNKFWRFLPGTSDPWFEISFADDISTLLSNDPREFFAEGAKQRFSEQLLENLPISAQHENGLISMTYERQYEVSPNEWKREQRIYDFDVRKNMLPVRLLQIYDGHVISEMTITYQDCQRSKAWFPLEKTYRTFPAETKISDLAQVKPVMSAKTTISDFQIGISVSDKLFVPPAIDSLPDGTQIRDKVKGETYQKYGVGDKNNNFVVRLTVVLLVNTIVVVLSIFFWWRSKRR